MLFSATFPEAIQRLSSDVLNNNHVMISNQKFVATNGKVMQRFISTTKDMKKTEILKLFKEDIAEAKKLDRNFIF